jgi:hypothetical protein
LGSESWRRRPSRILALLVALYKTHDLATLERLYVVDGLSLKQVADDLGPPASKRTVQRALVAGGIRLRPVRPPATRQLLMSRELLELRVDDAQTSLASIDAK